MEKIKEIYNYLKVKFCYRTYWKQWLAFFFVICFLVFACDSKSDLELDNTIEQTFSNYVEYWSEGDFDKIVNEIYGVPFVLYTQERTMVMNTEKEVKAFLISAFKTLDSNNYGYSIRNKWEHFKSDKNLSIIEMNFTRYLKDSTIMGANERSASYILRKYNGNHKIVGMIPHTPISE
ncbi:hypothetical protein N9V08_00040 [Flavobacteriales bacterium]|nr:hypothetical protein [Flavobacteriales bacterium]